MPSQAKPSDHPCGLNRRHFLKHSAATVAALPLLSRRLRAAEDQSPPKAASTATVLNPWRLEAVDLRRFMRLGVEHIYQGAVDRRRGCLPFVHFNLTSPPNHAGHQCWGSPHMVGRFLDALALTADLTGIAADNEVVDGLRTLLHQSLDNSWGLPFDSLPGPPLQKRAANMHNCRETILGLLALWQWRHCERSKALAQKLVQNIDQLTRTTGAFPSQTCYEDGWTKPDPNLLNYTCGRLIGGLLAYYRATQEELALDLAKRFADLNLRETFTPEGEPTAAAGLHLHSTEGTMTAILDLGVVSGESRYRDIGRRIYDVGLSRWRTSYGWAKENREDSPSRGEANNTGDFIEAALILAQSGNPQYFRDAERFLRNGLLASQIVNTDWIVEATQADTDDCVYSDLSRRARGAFAFTLPNGYHTYNTDLMGGALQSLAQAYHQIVTHDSQGAHVNMLFSCDSPWLTLRSSLPEQGRLEIRMRQASSLAIRFDDEALRSQVELRVHDDVRTTTWKDSELVVGDLTPDTRVTVTFPLPKRHTSERAPGHGVAEVDWLGDTIVAMQPQQGVVPLYPAV